MIRALVLFVLVACSGDSKAPASPTPPTGSMLSCARIADHVVTAVSANKLRSGATHAAVKDLVVTRCQADAWTDETKQCLHAIKTVAEGRACETTMTAEQRSAIRTQAKALRARATAGSGEPDTETDTDDWIRHVVQDEPDSVPR